MLEKHPSDNHTTLGVKVSMRVVRNGPGAQGVGGCMRKFCMAPVCIGVGSILWDERWATGSADLGSEACLLRLN